jgi:hypothetical protein
MSLSWSAPPSKTATRSLSFFPAAATVGENARFGPGGDVPVQLRESDDLHSLHGILMDAFGAVVQVDPLVPEYNGPGCHPHVTVVESRRLERGLALELRTLLLVEIGPEQDRSAAVPVAVAEVGKSEKGEPATAERTASTWSLLEREGIRSWVIGGWGIDALVGRQTREHHDLDLFLLDDDLRAMFGVPGVLRLARAIPLVGEPLARRTPFRIRRGRRRGRGGCPCRGPRRRGGAPPFGTFD